MESLGVEKLEGLAWNGVLYGKFLATVINFIVVGFVIFLLIKAMNAATKKKKDEETSDSRPTQEELLAEIRDLLKR
jgi:large conductance mechanosensitive channel